MMSSQTGEEIVNSADTIFSLRSVLCDVIIFSQCVNSITHTLRTNAIQTWTLHNQHAVSPETTEEKK